MIDARQTGLRASGTPTCRGVNSRAARRRKFAERAISLKLILAAAGGASAPVLGANQALAEDTSPPVTLQWFESTYDTIEKRMPDVFAAGYGNIYTPPPGRADSGNQSVGYDQYDRFDLGQAGNPTLYGTETGLRTLVQQTHTAGLSYTVDLVWNHSGFNDASNANFVAAGGYPGLAVSLTSTNNGPAYVDSSGDYHPASATGDQQMRLAGLVDIAQEKNYQLIRN